MRKIGYTTLQREIERRLKANNKARELLGMELKKPLVALSDYNVYITDNYSMFFVIPKEDYILPYDYNTDMSTFEKYINTDRSFRLWYEDDAIDLKCPKRDLSRYCAYIKDDDGKIKDTVKIYFVKSLLQRFYKDIHKLHLYNNGTKDGITHIYRNGVLVGIIAPFMKD